DTLLEALECRNQRFGDVASAERSESAAAIRQPPGHLLREQPLLLRLGELQAHVEISCLNTRASCRSPKAVRAASANRTIFSALLIPGRASTPLDTSTPKGSTAAIAAPTELASSPPARISSVRRASPRALDQSQTSPAPLTGPS